MSIKDFLFHSSKAQCERQVRESDRIKSGERNGSSRQVPSQLEEILTDSSFNNSEIVYRAALQEKKPSQTDSSQNWPRRLHCLSSKNHQEASGESKKFNSLPGNDDHSQARLTKNDEASYGSEWKISAPERTFSGENVAGRVSDELSPTTSQDLSSSHASTSDQTSSTKYALI